MRFLVETDILVKTRTNKRSYSLREEVVISVTVANKGLIPVELIFPSAQRYDFMILKSGREVWRWSDGRVFAMVLGTLFLKSGEEQTYKEMWMPKDVMLGEYEVIGIVTSRPSLEARCTFRMNG